MCLLMCVGRCLYRHMCVHMYVCMYMFVGTCMCVCGHMYVCTCLCADCPQKELLELEPISLPLAPLLFTSSVQKSNSDGGLFKHVAHLFIV